MTLEEINWNLKSYTFTQSSVNLKDPKGLSFLNFFLISLHASYLYIILIHYTYKGHQRSSNTRDLRRVTTKTTSHSSRAGCELIKILRLRERPEIDGPVMTKSKREIITKCDRQIRHAKWVGTHTEGIQLLSIAPSCGAFKDPPGLTIEHPDANTYSEWQTHHILQLIG